MTDRVINWAVLTPGDRPRSETAVVLRRPIYVRGSDVVPLGPWAVVGADTEPVEMSGSFTCMISYGKPWDLEWLWEGLLARRDGFDPLALWHTRHPGWRLADALRPRRN